jgi:hypothetical protein
MVISRRFESAGSASGDAANGPLVERTGETAHPTFDSLPAEPGANQDRTGITVVRALRRWLEANELVAIIIGVIGTLAVLSMLLVFGGYLFVTR